MIDTRLTTTSRIAGHPYTAVLDRRSFSTAAVDMRTLKSRVCVTMRADGSAVVTVHSLAEGGDANSTDPVNWHEETAVVLAPGRPVEVLAPGEPQPF